MSKRKISARFPEDLLEEIDAIAELEYSDRTALIKKALKEYIDRELEEGRLKEEAVNRYLEDKLEFAKLKKLLGEEEARSVRASKELIDEGEELAEKLA